MSKTVAQDCPLCDGQATYREISDPECKRFVCLVCVKFSIDEHSEHYVKNSTREMRAGWSSAAKAAGPDKLFFMREPTVEEGKTQMPSPLMIFGTRRIEP